MRLKIEEIEANLVGPMKSFLTEAEDRQRFLVSVNVTDRWR